MTQLTDANAMFDVVIVGGGSSGAVLAARLCDDASRRVLLIEAGPAYTDPTRLPSEIGKISDMSAATPWNQHNWAVLAQLTPDVNFRVPRGRVLGGSSAINGGVFVRGTRSDFDAWASAGNTGWSFASVLHHFVDLENDLNFAGPLHGIAGPVPVQRPGSELCSPLTTAFLDACAEAGFPAEADKNGDLAPGAGLLPANTVDGRRFNSAITHLLPVLDRKNLAIWADTFARRVVIRRKRAVGVEVESRIHGRTVVSAGHVVLSAGAVKSPHLMMLSGIGPADDLRAANVPVLHDLPGVGKNWMDHPVAAITYKTDRDLGFDARMQVPQASLNLDSGTDAAGDLELMLFVASTGAMLLGSPTGRISLPNAARDAIRDPVSIARSLRGLSPRQIVGEVRGMKQMQLRLILTQEDSRGSMTLRSANPATMPNLDYNYLSETTDIARMRDGIRTGMRILECSGMSQWVETIVSPSRSVVDDDGALRRWLRSQISTATHMAGTARMGPASDPGAVVDPQLRVHGLDGLSVVDTSIMPTVVRRAVNATAMMIAERAATFF